MASIAVGSSQTFTAGVRGATFTVIANGGTYATVTGASTASIGPTPARRTFGPYEQGQSITVAVQSGDVVLVEGGDSLPNDAAATVSTLSADKTISASDDGAIFYCTTALTLTIPAGLSPRPSFIVDCPPTGNASIASSGGALINGATTTLTRARSSNQAGFCVMAHQDADSYGVSGS